jgi:hypothetical protein
MSRATLPAIAIASLVLHASPALGALTTITGVGITPQGAFQLATPDSSWHISFVFDGDLASSSTDGEFGSWSFTIGNGLRQWSASGDGASGGSWTNAGGARVFTIDLAQGASAISSGSLSPTPTSVSIIYSAVRANGAWCSLGEALQRSQGTSFDAMRGGFVVRATTDGTADIGTIHSGYLVPAPGAAVLTAFAGVLAQRRRR